MIHSANAQTAKHHRLLLIGMDVGLAALPLPGEAGRTDEGTSRRLRRGNAGAVTSTSPAHTSGERHHLPPFTYVSADLL